MDNARDRLQLVVSQALVFASSAASGNGNGALAAPLKGRLLRPSLHPAAGCAEAVFAGFGMDANFFNVPVISQSTLGRN